MAEPELWTTRQAAEHCGVKPATYRDYTRRLDAPGPVPDLLDADDRANLYDAAAVRAWQAARPGRGWHGPHDRSEPRQKETTDGHAGDTGAR